MKKFLPLITLAVIVILAASCSNKRSGNPRVLVFSKTAGFRHSSIPNGKAAIMKLGQENGFDVDTTEDADMFNEDSLKKYNAKKSKFVEEHKLELLRGLSLELHKALRDLLLDQLS